MDTAPGTTPTQESTVRPAGFMDHTEGWDLAPGITPVLALTRAEHLPMAHTGHEGQLRLITPGPALTHRLAREPVSMAVGVPPRFNEGMIGRAPNVSPTVK